MKLDNLIRKVSSRGSNAKWFIAAAAAMFVVVQAGAQSSVVYNTQTFDSGFTGANGNMTHSSGATHTALNAHNFYAYTNGCSSFSSSCNVIHVLNKAGYRKSGDRCIVFPGKSQTNAGTMFTLQLPHMGYEYRLSALVLEFFMGTQSSSVGFMEIGYMNDYDASAFVPLDTVRADAQSYCASQGVKTTEGRMVTVRLNEAPDDALYFALRWNNEGNANAACCIDNLTVTLAPACPSVSNLATTSVDYSSATVTWSEIGIATQWQVSLDGGSPVTVSSRTHTFTGLTPGSSHTVSVVPVCSGSTATPVTVTFTTVTCDAVTGLAADAQYNAATITWDEGSVSQWQVSLNGGTPVTVSTNSYTFTGLTPNTDYTATVRTACTATILSDPQTVAFRTGCYQPRALQATDVTNGRMVLAWTGTASQYEVQIASDADFTADVQTQTVSTATATFPNLIVGRRYYVRVRAICSSSDISSWTLAINVLITDIPSTGLYPAQGLVVLNDLEDHSWSYYSDTNSPAPLHSYNPADVKIVYFGNGTTNVSTSSDAWPELSTFTAPSVSTISEGAAVGISEFDRRFDKFHYYQTLERVDGKTAATPEAATGRCPYRTIFNPFSLRPVYGTALPATTAKSNCRGWNGWRGFFCWRLKHVSGGAVYRGATGGTALAVGDTVGADVQLYFQPAASDGMEVEFEALWARAWLTIAYNGWGMQESSSYSSRGVFTENVGVERNFCVLQDYDKYIFQIRGSGDCRKIADVDGNFPTVPVTYTSVLPNGTTNGTTKAYEALSGTALRIHDDKYYDVADLPVRCHADTRFEYLTLRTYNAGSIHGPATVPQSSFSADGYNFTMGRGMKHYSETGGTFDNDHGINYLWGIGRITRPDKVDQAGTHQFYTDHFEEIYYTSSYANNLSSNAPDPDNLPGYSAADSNYINNAAATYRATGRSLNYTMRLETGRIGYPLAYYGWNNFVSHSSYGGGSGKRGLYCAPHVWVTGTDNRVRLILGNDYDRAREDPKQWSDTMAKDSCSLRTSVPFRGGNYWIQMPNQNQDSVCFTAVIKSGFHGYRMWRRAYDSATGSFFAGGHATPGFNYDTSGYSGSEGKYGSGQIDYISSSNGSLPYGFGDGGTDGDPKNIYIGVSNNPTMFKGKRYCLVEGGYLWTSLSGCAWDTVMSNRNDNDVSIIRMKGGQIYGSIFGGTNTYADGAGGRQIICTGGKVWGWLSGGANGTAIADRNELAGHHWGSTYIYVGGTFELGNDTADRRVGTYINTVGRTGANDGNLFGAGCGIKPYSKYASAAFNEHAWKFHECGEVWNSTVVVADHAHVKYDVYGGGNYGYNMKGYGSDVRILGGRVGGKVFGGSNNKSTGSSYIRMTGGLVEQGVYGGCNNWGVLLGDVRMDILGGTIGTSTWTNAGVYGGGYGENTSTAGDITVNIGDSTTGQGPRILGNVYGGSQMGMVLGGDTTSSDYEIYTFRTTNENGGREVTATSPFAVVGIDTTGRYSDTNVGVVNYYAGMVLGGFTSPCDTCRGKIFGGGYGENGKNATSYGEVIVNIRGDFDGDVFGANNLNGKPMGGVQVNIGSADSVAAGQRNRPVVGGDVYGGGNLAAFGHAESNETLKVDMHSGTVEGNVFGAGKGTPATATLPAAKRSTNPVTHVVIHAGMVKKNVYGGGNAAKVEGDTKVEIGK